MGNGLMGELYETILDRVQIAFDGFTACAHRANATQSHITETLGWQHLFHPLIPRILRRLITTYSVQ
uniref:Uncharacterized protein n=1 Tax=Meloidogyne enterolobii TaxID=390850 RepID=A0A6V7W5U6_MELEN|nr:unnamed protein product [Meloidogyne enterolobii]